MGECFVQALPPVVYFDQLLGAAHSKRWSKYAFSTFFSLKAEKRKIERNLQQNSAKNRFSKFALKRWSSDATYTNPSHKCWQSNSAISYWIITSIMHLWSDPWNRGGSWTDTDLTLLTLVAKTRKILKIIQCGRGLSDNSKYYNLGILHENLGPCLLKNCQNTDASL